MFAGRDEFGSPVLVFEDYTEADKVITFLEKGIEDKYPCGDEDEDN